MKKGVTYPRLNTRLEQAQAAVVPVELKLAEEIRRVLSEVRLRGEEIDDSLAVELSGRISTPEQVHKHLCFGIQKDPLPLDTGFPLGQTYMGRLGVNRGRCDDDMFHVQPNSLKGPSGLDRVMNVLGREELRILIRTSALIAIQDAVDFSCSGSPVSRRPYYRPGEGDLLYACREQVDGANRIISGLSVFGDPRLLVRVPSKF